MKLLNSINTNGSEGILMAAVNWWLDVGWLGEEAKRLADTVDPRDFTDRRDNVLADQLVVHLQRDLVRDFWTCILKQEAAAHMVVWAAASWKNMPEGTTAEQALASNRPAVDAFILGIVKEGLARAFKATGFFDRHKKEIEAEKRRKKIVRDIMER